MGRKILMVKTLKIHAMTILFICSRPPLIEEVPIIFDLKYGLQIENKRNKNKNYNIFTPF